MAEIRIAVCGYLHAVKTTVIDALFGAKYGEVSMQCTTACVNAYPILRQEMKLGTQHKNTKPNNIDSNEDFKDGQTNANCTLEAKALLEQFKADNKTFCDSDEVKEMFRDIQLQENLQDMVKNVTMVIVDIPGINEA